MKVDFFIVGAQKCGTSTLAAMLSAHPQVSFCTVKEPDFFNYSVSADTNAVRQYHRLFIKKQNSIYGEASTMYSSYPEYAHTARQISLYNPEAKIIYIVRHPVKRIRSHYWHNLINQRTRYHVSRMFDEIRLDPTYLSRSRYGLQITQYGEVFPKENILIVFLENLMADPDSTLKLICHFLHISPLKTDTIPQEIQHLNRSAARSSAGLIYRLLGKTDLSNLLPLHWKHLLYKQLTRQVKAPPHFTPEQYQWILNQLIPDIRQLNHYTGEDVYKLWEIADKY